MKRKSDNAPSTEIAADGPSDANIERKKDELQQKMAALDQIGTEFDTWQEGETQRIKKAIDEEVPFFSLRWESSLLGSAETTSDKIWLFLSAATSCRFSNQFMCGV